MVDARSPNSAAHGAPKVTATATVNDVLIFLAVSLLAWIPIVVIFVFASRPSLGHRFYDKPDRREAMPMLGSWWSSFSKRSLFDACRRLAHGALGEQPRPQSSRPGVRGKSRRNGWRPIARAVAVRCVCGRPPFNRQRAARRD